MKQKKPLTREKYLKQFSRAARWRLPPQESEEAISDYRELLFQEERDESRLAEELGDPVQAAHLLTDVKTYRRWLAVFAVLAFGLFLLAKWAWTARSWAYRFLWWDQMWFPVLVMAVCIPLSLVWFQRNGQKDGPLSKRLILAMAAVLAVGVGTMALFWYTGDAAFIKAYVEMHKASNAIPWQIRLLRELITEGGVACTLAALAGLVLARCYDRRWIALYTLSLTVAALFVCVMFALCAMDLSYDSAYHFLRDMFSWIVPVGAAGLIGTGAALC